MEESLDETDNQHSCQYCDGFPGSVKTYANQVLMPIKGKVRCIDYCIHKIVAALNAGNVITTDCCCGHGKMPGYIGLEDGRILAIFANRDEARMNDNLENNVRNHLHLHNPAIWQPLRHDGN